MHIETFNEGIAILGSWPNPEVQLALANHLNGRKLSLVIADPPYGKILKNKKWDVTTAKAYSLALQHAKHCSALEQYCVSGAALYWFGGYGLPGYRVFYRWVLDLEELTSWQMAMHVTWSKRRAYGVQHNYLSTREEIAYCVLGNDIKKPFCFDPPYTDEIRGYEGYNPDYPAKSKYKRRTAVWTDVTEIFRGKLSDAQKPVKLLKIPIEAHTMPGQTVLDLFACTGSTSVAARELGRRFIAIEDDENEYQIMIDRLKRNAGGDK